MLKADGKTLEGGSEYQLADDGWRLDHSEYSDLDKQSTEHCVDVDERRLDFVLLRLKKKAGEEYIGGIKRGWIEIVDVEHSFQPNTPLLILHHPYGDPLTFDLDARSILEVNTQKTRVRYTMNTESGSSGSPCFTANWELVAIHQSGEPDFTHSAKYNQGIPIATILHRLKKYGTDKLLGPRSEEKGGIITFPFIDAPSVQFDPPEDMMSGDEQQRLALLLDKQSLSAFSFTGSRHMSVTREMMEHINSKQLPSHLYFLLKGYKRVISTLVEQARNPFAGSTDLLPEHFKNMFEQLDLVEDCLRKICILLQYAIPPLDTSIVNQITVEVDHFIQEKQKFYHFLDSEKKRYNIRNSSHIKRNVKNEFTVLTKKLDEFLRKIPES